MRSRLTFTSNARPVWFDATSSGGTPMCAALTKAAEAAANGATAILPANPPAILHVTDGQSTDGNPEHIADGLRQISTQDGTARVVYFEEESGCRIGGIASNK